MARSRLLPTHVLNLRRIRQIHAESDQDDAEALARLFEDRQILDDGTVNGRVAAILEATEHRWIPGIHTPLDVPGLYEVKQASDRGFRREYRDPWPGSRDQIGHLLTAFALALFPVILEVRRFGLRVRDLVGAPRDMNNEEVGLRLTIGHEKAPDPGRYDPLILIKLRRQFRSATDDDVAAFRRALNVLASDIDLDLDRVCADLEGIGVGVGTGNSLQDLNLSLASYRLAQLVREDRFERGQDIAGWIRRNLKAAA